MKFKILSEKVDGKERFSVWFYDECNQRMPSWKKVIWDEESYLQFRDNNYVDTVDEAKYKAHEFKEKYENKHGKVVAEFSL